MFGFALGCAICGIALGLVSPSVLVLAITSFQIIAVLVGLWLGGVLDGKAAAIWSVAGLFLHQGAYLAGLIAGSLRADRRAAQQPTLATQVDDHLRAMDGLVGRIETTAPATQGQTAELRKIIGRMRQALGDEESLDQLRRNRRRAGV